jgi:hypothetical protein
MRTLKNHTILFDAECPMCNLYTKAFVNAGLLDKAGREAYQRGGSSCSVVDIQRAVNEIALVDNTTGEVIYGMKSLIKVLSRSFPMLEIIFKFKPFLWLAEKSYAFVSYNRRVIIPADTEQSIFPVQPSFRKDYRLAYLLFTGLATAAILSGYSSLLYPFFPGGVYYREYVVCFGQLFFQGLIAATFFRDKLWNYLGNMMTISFTGALLLLPVVILSQQIDISNVFALVYFMCVVGLMLVEHIRRSKLLHIGWSLTLTWVIYRLVVLLIIFKVGTL